MCIMSHTFALQQPKMGKLLASHFCPWKKEKQQSTATNK